MRNEICNKSLHPIPQSGTGELNRYTAALKRIGDFYE